MLMGMNIISYSTNTIMRYTFKYNITSTNLYIKNSDKIPNCSNTLKHNLTKIYLFI